MGRDLSGRNCGEFNNEPLYEDVLLFDEYNEDELILLVRGDGRGGVLTFAFIFGRDGLRGVPFFFLLFLLVLARSRIFKFNSNLLYIFLALFFFLDLLKNINLYLNIN